MLSVSFVQVILLAVAVSAVPTKKDEFQTPAQDRKWGKFFGEEEKPQFEINPNFGFRSYHQIRYEPMTIPFEQPVYPPMDMPYGPAGGYGDGGYGDGGYTVEGGYDDGYGYESVNNFQAVQYPENNNNNSDDAMAPEDYLESIPPNEYSSRNSRQLSFRKRFLSKPY